MKKNAVLNGFRNILNLLFPLITFPYISKVLQVEKLGSYNFASSIVSYFILIAGLGISTYAVREGVNYKENREKFEQFVSEIFTINIISMIFSFICLCLCLCFFRYLRSYTKLILILSFQILFITLGVDWIYGIYEEYTYITIRSIVFKLISIMLMFIFVKSPNSLNRYAALTVFSSAGASISNLIHLRKYCKLHFVKIKKCLVHLKPLLIIFASNIAIMIYVYSDTTMLGFQKNDYCVGIYSVSVKVYTIVKNLLSSILLVTIPRISLLYGQGMMWEFKIIVQNVFDYISIALIPCVVGIFLLSEEIVVFISDSTYIRAASSLRILSISLLFCIIGWIYNQCILLPAKKEKFILISTILSAIVNVLLNYFLIPILDENATAVTTMLSELIMLIMCKQYGKKICKIHVMTRNLKTVLLSCFPIVLVCFLIRRYMLETPNTIRLFVAVGSSVVAYVLSMFLMRNEVFIRTMQQYIKLLKSKRENFNRKTGRGDKP